MQNKKVLFVDDDESLLRMYKKVLEQKGGYDVATEQNAKLAFKKACDFKPQIIFLDVNMPDLQGSEVAYEINSDAALSKVPIIFLTGAISDQEVVQAGGKIGGWHFLAKPILPKDLLRCIEEHLGA